MNSSVQTDERAALQGGPKAPNCWHTSVALGKEHDLMPCFSASVKGASRASFRWARRVKGPSWLPAVRPLLRLHFQVVYYCCAAGSVVGIACCGGEEGESCQRQWPRLATEEQRVEKSI